MRFSCPSAAANRGRPVADAEKDLVQLSHLLVQHLGRSADKALAPLLQAGHQLPWPDVCRIVQVLVEIVEDRSDRLERRLRRCLAVARVCEQNPFYGLQGEKLSKYLRAVRTGLETDVPRQPEDVPLPGHAAGRDPVPRPCWPFITPRDRDVYRGRAHWQTTAKGWSTAGSFVRGRGSVPRAQRISSGNQLRCGQNNPKGLPPPELDGDLGTELCGQTEFDAILRAAQLQPSALGRPRIPRILTLPMILWLKRAFTRRVSGERGATSDSGR